MSNSTQLARQWWGTLDPADRQRVWDSRHSYLAGDLVESMANVGVPGDINKIGNRDGFQPLGDVQRDIFTW